MNELIEKIGVDKILHFLMGALIAFSVSVPLIMREDSVDIYVNVMICTIGLIVAVIAAWAKETIIDEKWDWYDFIATIVGACVPYAAVALGTLFSILSYG